MSSIRSLQTENNCHLFKKANTKLIKNAFAHVRISCPNVLAPKLLCAQMFAPGCLAPKCRVSTFLFYLPVFTNSIVNHMSQAKPRRKANSKLVRRFLITLRSKSPSYTLVVAILHKVLIMAFINPRFVRKNKVLLL